MDAVKALQQIHKEFTECPLCTDQFVTPKMMPCLHTFCLLCLERYGNDKKVGDKICCPLCRQEFTLVTGRFASLPNNFNINRLVELRELFGKAISGNNNWCQVCNVSEDTGAGHMTAANSYCTNCKLQVCSMCASKHKDDYHHSVNNLFPCGATGSDSEIGKEFCNEHPQELLKLFCLKCNIATCVKCFCQSHNTHKCCDIDEAAEQCTKEIDLELKKLHTVASSFKHTSARHARKIAAFSDSLSQTERQISEAANKVKKSVDYHRAKLIQSLKASSQSTLAQMQESKMMADSSVSAVDCLTKQAKQIQASGNQLSIVQLSCKIKKETSELEASLAKNHTIHKQFFFFPTSHHDSSVQNLIGNIVECDEELLDDQSESESESDDDVACSDDVTVNNQPVRGTMNSVSSDEESDIDFTVLDLKQETICHSPLSDICARCGWNHDVTFCTYPPDITCYKCRGNHHMRVCVLNN